MTVSKDIRQTLLMLMGLVLCLTACRDEADQPMPPGDEPASLSFSIKLPKATLTRGYNEPDSDPAGWTDWEKYVDGQKLYRVTVFLIREDNTLVGFRDLYAGNDHLDENNKFNDDYTEVHVTFDYDVPKHGAIEKLRRGKYRLMAVANYSAVTANGKSYGGLTTFANQIETLKTAFEGSGDTGIANFTATNEHYRNFFNATLVSGDDGICPQTPQPLTLVEENITLHPGRNEYSGQLVRTYSRIRIAVENISTTSALTVKSLTFSENFAQRTAYLFSNHSDRYEPTEGTLIVTSDDAITKFAETSIPKIVLNNGSQSNQQVVFDAYVLESQNENSDYTYTLELEYPEENIQSYQVSSTTAINSISDLNTALESTTYFVFQNINSQKRFLKRNDNNTALATADVDLDDISGNSATLAPYVWQLEKAEGDNNYYIKTAGLTAYYMGNPINGDTPVSLDPEKTVYFTFSSTSNNICMKSNEDPKNYINVNGGKQDIAGGWNANDKGSQYDVFPISTYIGHPMYNIPITLTTIDPVTAAINKVTHIERNDFIEALITVSYYKEEGTFNIATKPWVNKDNFEIEFH